MQSKRRTSYRVEFLESRTLLSTVPAPPMVAAQLARPASRLATILAGPINGRFQADVSNPSQGASAAIDGDGNLRPLGPVVATGTLAGVPVPGGAVQGRLVLSNASGELFLDFSGRVPRNLRTPPRANVVVRGGTGAYAGMSGAGLAVLRPQNIAPDLMSGTFTVQLRTSLVRR